MTRINIHIAPKLNCTACYHPDGWYEIRENDNADGWIRTGTPVLMEL
jgi:hypothetical protein